MPRSQILNYRIHGRLHCDPSVRNGLRQDVIQNSFWHHEIECTWGWGETQRASEGEVCSTTTYFSCQIHSSEKWRHTDVCFLFTSSHVLGWAWHWMWRLRAWEVTIALTDHESMAALYLNSRSSERLCQQIFEIGPLVFGRYALSLVVFLGTFHTFHPTLVLIGGKVFFFYSCNQIS